VPNNIQNETPVNSTKEVIAPPLIQSKRLIIPRIDRYGKPKDNIQNDTLISNFDSLGILVSELWIKNHGKKRSLDSIVYDITEDRDTFYNWTNYTKSYGRKIEYRNIYDLDSLGRIIKKTYLNGRDSVENETYEYFYDDKGRYSQRIRNIFYRKISDHWNYKYLDTFNCTIINHKYNKHNNPKFNYTSVDSIFYDSLKRVAKKVKWSDQRSTKYNDKLPNCLNCIFNFTYDKKNREILRKIHKTDKDESGYIQYFYNKYGALNKEIKVMNGDTTIIEKIYQMDKYDNWIDCKQYENNVLKKHNIREIKYWPQN